MKKISIQNVLSFIVVFIILGSIATTLILIFYTIAPSSEQVILEPAKQVIYYDLPVVSEKSCTQYEIYIESKKSCRLECETPENCKEKQDLINQELEERLSLYVSKSYLVLKNLEDLKSGNLYPSSYLYDQGQFIHNSGVHEDQNLYLLKLVTDIVPEEYLGKSLNEVVFYNDQASEFLASVLPAPDYKSSTLNINTKIFKSSTFVIISSIVHELMHIIDHTEARPAYNDKDCNGVFINYGCYEGQSLKNQFYEEFYKRGYDDRNSFVSEYAMTNISEDLAESFRVFVTSSLETESKIAKQKVDFFKDKNKFVSLKKDIIDSHGTLLRQRVKLAI
ncbi:MAG: putative zinc-binding metallopeptidase [Patescibacteria group bacterium]